jgi:hypothetical protein
MRDLTIEEAAMALWVMRFGSHAAAGRQRSQGEVEQGFDPKWLIPTPDGRFAQPKPEEVAVLDTPAARDERIAARQRIET